MSAPSWSRWLLGRLAPQGHADDVVGDLEETHARRIRERGRLLAHVVTAFETLDVAFALGRCRYRFDRGGLGVSVLDFKLGLRMLSRNPALSFVSVIGMSIAIAVGVGYFEFFNSFVDTKLPIEEGDRVVSIRQMNRAGATEGRILADFVAWRNQLTTVDELSAFTDVSRNLITPAGVSLVAVAEITATGFNLPRVKPLLGRALLAEDERPEAPPVLVIGYEEWQRHFQGDRAVVGQEVRLGSDVRTIVGVMPEGFRFPSEHDYWIPLKVTTLPMSAGEGPWLYLFGRVRKGATLESAQAELTTLGRRGNAVSSGTAAEFMPLVSPYTHAFTGITSPGMALSMRSYTLLLGLLLILVAANVSIIIYARTAARASEIVVRTALGASRARVTTQLFVEACVLSAISAVIGVLLATTALRMVMDWSKRNDNSWPFWMDMELSAATITYAVALALIGGVIVGVIPALKMTGRGMNDGLKQLSVRGSQIQLGRTWTALIVAQVAIAVGVLPFALVMVGGALRGVTTAVGYAADEILHARITMDGAGTISQSDSAQRLAFDRALVLRTLTVMQNLESEPRIRAVTYATGLPHDGMKRRFTLEETDAGSDADVAYVGVNYFQDMGVPLLAGRTFTSADTLVETQSVIVDRVFVDQVLGGGNPVGRTIGRMSLVPGSPPSEYHQGPPLQIVGMVGPMTTDVLGKPNPRVYLPHRLERAHNLMLSVRVADNIDPGTLAGRVRQIAAAVDPNLELLNVRTGTEVERERREAMLGLTMMITGVVTCVLLLSIAGIYALMSFTVVRRRREIGIRMALGASRWNVLRGIFARAGAQIGAGALAGLILGAAFDRLAADELLSGGGLQMLPIVVAMVMGIGLLAAFGPARRSLSVQPTETLRAD